MRNSIKEKIKEEKAKKMANDNHLFPILCYNEIVFIKDWYNDFLNLSNI